MRITGPITITRVITMSESERWKSLCIAIHVQSGLVFEGKDDQVPRLPISGQHRGFNDCPPRKYLVRWHCAIVTRKGVNLQFRTLHTCCNERSNFKSVLNQCVLNIFYKNEHFNCIYVVHSLIAWDRFLLSQRRISRYQLFVKLLLII